MANEKSGRLDDFLGIPVRKNLKRKVKKAADTHRIKMVPMARMILEENVDRYAEAVQPVPAK